MPLIASDYRRPWYLPHAHLETIVPALTRRVRLPALATERITIFDGDFLDIAWLAPSKPPRGMVIITHGLEGTATRGYMLGMAKAFWLAGFRVLLWHHRGCSGALNLLPRFYHSGASEDLAAMVEYALGRYPEPFVGLVGFSLGGNMTLKYLGEQGAALSPRIQAAVTFSVPLDLASCARALCQARNWVYAQKFKRSLLKKVRQKGKLFPAEIQPARAKSVKSLIDFDDHFTAPLHGFADAQDYYRRASAKQFLHNIHIPTLIVNAQNDPFFGAECYPHEFIATLPHVYFETPSTGGHCGFAPADGRGLYWSERRAVAFITAQMP